MSLPSFSNWALAIALAVAIAGASAYLTDAAFPASPWVLVTMALSSLFAFRFQHMQKISFIGTLSTGLGIVVFYLLMKNVIPTLLPAVTVSYSWMADAWISFLFIGMMFAYLYLQYQTESQLSRKLFIALNAGFYLDEWATRTTLKVWPIRVPRTSKKKSVIPTEVIYE